MSTPLSYLKFSNLVLLVTSIELNLLLLQYKVVNSLQFETLIFVS